jgi:hypothetical protein
MTGKTITERVKNHTKKIKHLAMYNITATQFSEKGWPDIFFIFYGKFVGVEIKGDNDKLNINQINVAKKILDSGARYFVLCKDRIFEASIPGFTNEKTAIFIASKKARDSLHNICFIETGKMSIEESVEYIAKKLIP